MIARRKVSRSMTRIPCTPIKPTNNPASKGAMMFEALSIMLINPLALLKYSFGTIKVAEAE